MSAKDNKMSRRIERLLNADRSSDRIANLITHTVKHPRDRIADFALSRTLKYLNWLEGERK